jgi:hypothetical protein
LGIRVETGKGIAKVKGGKRVTGVALCAQAGEGAVLEEISCDAVAMSGGWSPVVHLWSHCGGKLIWDEAGAMFRPDPTRPPTGADGQGFVRAVGAANGFLGTAEGLADAHAAGGGVGDSPGAVAPVEGPMAPVWMMPQGASISLREKMWLDYQNDVKVSDVQLAAREGYESVEHTKRYTTLGMATDQGKLSNINGWRFCRIVSASRSRRWGRRPSARPIRRFRWARLRGRPGMPCSSRCGRPRSTAGMRRTGPSSSRWGNGAAPIPSAAVARALIKPSTGK